MKIVWLAPYQLTHLLDKLVFLKKNIPSRPASWIDNLSSEIAKHVDLHIITKSAHISSDTVLCHQNITFHIIKYNFPFTNRGYPKYLRIDRVLRYNGLIKKIIVKLEVLNPDLVHAHGTEYAYALAAVKAHYPNIISIQGLISEIYKNAFNLQKGIEKYTLRNGANFGCRTDWDHKIVQRFNPYAKIYYLHEIINPAFFNSQWKDELAQNEISFVGSISKMKGIDILLESFSLLKNSKYNIQLNLIGSGNNEYLDKIKKRISELGVENDITFHGFLRPSEVIKVLLKSKALVLPSFMENSPNTIMEAQAMGMPVIASEVGGIPSLIKHRKNGMLFESKNVQELCNSIEMIIRDSNLRKRISEGAHKIGIARNHPDKVINDYLKAYQEIIKQDE